MIEYNDYEKINKYLDNNELDKIREYIEKEYKKTNLMLAKEALSKYLDTYRSVYDHIDGKILASDFKSVYIFDDDKLFSDYRKKKLADPTHKVSDDVNRIYEVYTSCLLSDKLEVGIIKKGDLLDWTNKTVYEVSSVDGSITYCFYKKIFESAKEILGNDVKYSLLNGTIACFAESERGKGLIMGIGKNNQ